MCNISLRCLLLVFLLGLPGAQAAAQSNATSPLGVNVREIRYWGTETHLVDFFKRAGNGAGGIWLTQCAWPCANGNTWNSGEQALLDLDVAGWPKSLPASGSTALYRWVTTILWMNSDKLPTGRWTVLYDGEGSLAYGQSNVTRVASASQPGRDVFEVSAGANMLTLSITATDPQRNGNYLRNIRVIAPGGTCNNDPMSYAADASACPGAYRPFTETYASQPFHPRFLSAMRPFAALRFMQFFSTNLDQGSAWAERSQLSDISWGYDGNRGAPIEIALDLANALDASPWLSVPAMVSDDYVRQYARLAKARLTTMRPVYLEYGNEVWNGSYPYSIAGQWVRDQGRARWPSSSEPDFAKQMNWFALRTKQLCAIWKQEFAERASQVKCVMGAQGAGSWTTDHYILSCPLHAAEPGGTACNATAGIDAVATGYYVGGHLNYPEFQAEIESQWFTQADGGLTKLFQELNSGDALTPPAGYTRARASLSLIVSQLAANKPVADRHGVDMVVYEGGNELRGSDGSAYQVRMQALAERAQRDPRMGTLYNAVLTQWKAIGGKLYMVFESTGAYSSARGNSTLLEWTGQARSESPKYDAVLSFIEANPCWWSGCSPALTMTFSQGWNLAGNGTDATLDVASYFSDARVVSLWKWVSAGSTPGISYPTWAFYSPQQGDGGRSYASARGYELLNSIGAGEGYWLNARSAFSVQLPAGNALASTAFRGMAAGWHLIATGNARTPSAFNLDLSASPPPAGTIPQNIASLWAWDGAQGKWYFYAPDLDAQGGTRLLDYIRSRSYLDFAAANKLLGPGVGFWVNVPPP